MLMSRPLEGLKLDRNRGFEVFLTWQRDGLGVVAGPKSTGGMQWPEAVGPEKVSLMH